MRRQLAFRKHEAGLTGLEILLGIVLVAISIATFTYAMKLFLAQKAYAGIETMGVSIGLLGGAFDPINALWLMLPFTHKSIKEPESESVAQAILFPIACLCVLIGWAGRHFFS